jgi:hypothetical protein
MTDNPEYEVHGVYPYKDLDRQIFRQAINGKETWNTVGCPLNPNPMWHSPGYGMGNFSCWNTIDAYCRPDDFTGAQIEDYYPRFQGVLDAMLPRLDPAIDMVVWVAEFDEVIGLLMKPWTIWKKIKNRKKLKKTSLADKFSNQWLERNFAVKPTVADTINLVKAVMSWAEKLEALKKGAGLDKLHAARGGFTENIDLVDRMMWDQVSCGCDKPFKLNLVETRHKLRGGVTVLYSYELPNAFDPFWEKYSAFLQAIGGSISAKTVWDLIPFSFVVDWIIDVGGWLDQFKFEAFPVNVVIRDMCLSLKEDRAYGMKIWGCYTNYSWHHFGSLKFQNYQRRAMKEIPVKLTPRLPNLFQFSLGTALAYTLGKSTLKWD